MKEGRQYRFEVARTEWRDGGLPDEPDGASADGFFSWELLPWVPYRRHMAEPWLKLMGRVGPTGEVFPIGAGPFRHKADSDGELFLYVNDAVLGLIGEGQTLPYRWSWSRNVGTASVRVTALE